MEESAEIGGLATKKKNQYGDVGIHIGKHVSNFGFFCADCYFGRSFFLLRAPFRQYGPVAALSFICNRSRLASWTREKSKHGKLSARGPEAKLFWTKKKITSMKIIFAVRSLRGRPGSFRRDSTPLWSRRQVVMRYTCETQYNAATRRNALYSARTKEKLTHKVNCKKSHAESLFLLLLRHNCAGQMT